ncbi:MAG: hypothetical protein ACPGO5_01305 [Patescibacteria group bacterium]
MKKNKKGINEVNAMVYSSLVSLVIFLCLFVVCLSKDTLLCKLAYIIVGYAAISEAFATNKLFKNLGYKAFRIGLVVITSIVALADVEFQVMGSIYFVLVAGFSIVPSIQGYRSDADLTFRWWRKISLNYYVQFTTAMLILCSTQLKTPPVYEALYLYGMAIIVIALYLLSRSSKLKMLGGWKLPAIFYIVVYLFVQAKYGHYDAVLASQWMVLWLSLAVVIHIAFVSYFEAELIARKLDQLDRRAPQLVGTRQWQD